MASKLKGFTLMELMITIVIMGILATFALPNYNKSLEKAHERDAINQLASINAANSVYQAHSGGLYLQSAAENNHTFLNSNLNLNIIPEDMEYCYISASPYTSYHANAKYTHDGTNIIFALRVTGAALSSTNPCCLCGNCPTLSPGSRCAGWAATCSDNCP